MGGGPRALEALEWSTGATREGGPRREEAEAGEPVS